MARRYHPRTNLDLVIAHRGDASATWLMEGMYEPGEKGLWRFVQTGGDRLPAHLDGQIIGLLFEGFGTLGRVYVDEAANGRAIVLSNPRLMSSDSSEITW